MKVIYIKLGCSIILCLILVNIIVSIIRSYKCTGDHFIDDNAPIMRNIHKTIYNNLHEKWQTIGMPFILTDDATFCPHNKKCIQQDTNFICELANNNTSAIAVADRHYCNNWMSDDLNNLQTLAITDIITDASPTYASLLDTELTVYKNLYTKSLAHIDTIKANTMLAASQSHLLRTSDSNVELRDTLLKTTTNDLDDNSSIITQNYYIHKNNAAASDTYLWYNTIALYIIYSLLALLVIAGCAFMLFSRV